MTKRKIAKSLTNNPVAKEDFYTDALDHLGIVAATADNLQLKKVIDKLLPMTNGAKTTHGQRVLAMVLNGLGFIDTRLYMFTEFLDNKPVELLLGEGVHSSDFNDATLGRCLDAISEYGETKLFSQIALSIALKFNLLTKSVHLDTTSLSVYGEYDTDDQVKPMFGHAKNKRFDLKQMILLLATTGKSGFPLYMQALSGNASDQKTLPNAAQKMQELMEELKLAPDLLFVGDSALYANCVEHGNNLLWVSRVPENIKLAKEIIEKTDYQWTNLDNGYKIHTQEIIYKNVKQRWALIYSQIAYDKEIITLQKDINKENVKFTKELWHIGNTDFGCQKDIDTQMKKLNKKLKYHTIDYKIQKIENNDKTIYKLIAQLVTCTINIEKIKNTKGRFIIATNQLDKEKLPDNLILPTYKAQSGTESGFKFIKNNSFEVSSIFLKKPQRISALMMIMTLCLMIYSYAQFFIRDALKKNNDTILSAKKKPTNNPSMEYIFKLFAGVCIVRSSTYGISNIVSNMKESLRKIVNYFGEYACKIYGITFIAKEI